MTLKSGDRLILASDGLDTLSPEEIEQAAVSNDDAGLCAKALLSAVELAAAPRQDNTTAMVADVATRSSGDTTLIDVEEAESFEDRILREYAIGLKGLDI